MSNVKTKSCFPLFPADDNGYCIISISRKTIAEWQKGVQTAQSQCLPLRIVGVSASIPNPEGKLSKWKFKLAMRR